jgi:hypothetical protein
VTVQCDKLGAGGVQKPNQGIVVQFREAANSDQVGIDAGQQVANQLRQGGPETADAPRGDETPTTGERIEGPARPCVRGKPEEIEVGRHATAHRRHDWRRRQPSGRHGSDHPERPAHTVAQRLDPELGFKRSQREGKGLSDRAWSEQRTCRHDAVTTCGDRSRLKQPETIMGIERELDILRTSEFTSGAPSQSSQAMSTVAGKEPADSCPVPERQATTSPHRRVNRPDTTADQSVWSAAHCFDHQVTTIASDGVQPEEHATAGGVELRLDENGHRERGVRDRTKGGSANAGHGFEEGVPPCNP